MKIEIETACNGYIITIPAVDDEDIEKKIVIENSKENEYYLNDSKVKFESFTNLVDQLQEIFELYNSKHNTIGYVNGICSENIRWDINEKMRESLKNPKNDNGD